MTADYADHQLQTRLLRDVSRSFYLTLRVLPRKIRPQIGLAYLLARLADTVADTQLVPPQQRLRTLANLRDRILGKHSEPVDFGQLLAHQGLPAERALLEKSELILNQLGILTHDDQARMREVLATIISGQELDLQRFAGASASHLVSLASESELDDYTYRVAGCVGEFWTRMCRAHLFPWANLNDAALVQDGVRFGRGLQLVNILRDLPGDLRQGRCYIPQERLAEAGLVPASLLDEANESGFRPIYNPLLDKAEALLRSGWSYTNTLPLWCVRLRLACAWPLLLGHETLQLLRLGNVLDSRHRLKVSRRRVRRILWRSLVFYPFPRRWRGLFPAPAKVTQ